METNFSSQSVAAAPMLPGPERSASESTNEQGLVTGGVGMAAQGLGGTRAIHEEGEGLHISPIHARLPVTMSVSVPVRNFRVRNLLAMGEGTLIESQWGHGEDLPLLSGDVQLAWTEFEVVDSRLGVRVTRLA